MQLALPFQLPEHLHSTRFLPPVWLSHPRWNDEKPSPPVPCQPNKQQRHQAILLYVEPQIKPWRTIDLPTLKADSHHSQLWSKRLQTMTLVALKMSSWKQLDPSFLWMRMLKHYKGLIHSYGTGVKVEIFIQKPYSISQLGKHCTQPLCLRFTMWSMQWLWPN